MRSGVFGLISELIDLLISGGRLNFKDEIGVFGFLRINFL